MSDLFLPFTPAGKETELKAIEVKKELQVGRYDPVDPFEALSEVPVRLVSEDRVRALPDKICEILLGSGRREWSAVSFSAGDQAPERIIVNPTHHPHRQRATLMEELVHIIRGHPRTTLSFNDDGSFNRQYQDDVEDEAYNVGAACLIPYRPLFYRVSEREQTAEQIASAYEVSEAHVMYRIKRSGLYDTYRARQRTG